MESEYEVDRLYRIKRQAFPGIYDRWQKSGIIVFVITHDLELLTDCCTNVIHLEDGEVVEQYRMDEEGLEKIRDYFIK